MKIFSTSNKVTEKFIWLNWAAEPPKSGYEYTTMLDAIREHKLKYQEYPLWFTRDRWNKLHKVICSLPAWGEEDLVENVSSI